MSPAFIFTAALLCGVIIGLLTPMVVAYIRDIRVTVYRKDQPFSPALQVIDVDVDALPDGWFDLPENLRGWDEIPGIRPEDSAPVDSLHVGRNHVRHDPPPDRSW